MDLVRIATEVFEQQLPPLAADEAERRVLVEAILRFGREIAFAAATVYAGAAENRGAWDARQEALVVDAVVRGEADDALVSRASALGLGPRGHGARAWSAAPPTTSPAGPSAAAPGGRSGRPRRARRGAGRAPRRAACSDPGGLDDAALVRIAGRGLRARPGRRRPGGGRPRGGARQRAGGTRRAAGRTGLAGRTAAGRGDGLLPERALCGDVTAHARLRETVVAPLADAGGELARTLEVYLEGGGSLESCARTLFVHPNTVRYRLRRVGEITGHVPTDPRAALVLRAALIIGRLDP